MATLTPNVVNAQAGVRDDNALVAAAGGGDAFPPGGDIFVRINNGGGSPITPTFVTPGTVRGNAIADGGGAVTNAQSRIFGPFPADMYADPTTGLVTVTYTGVTSVTIGVFRLQSQ
jgi:hypothetical protein